ncbi:hypothetical protein [Helicobacter winghamensis]|uniref:hypothetical protein n=1 Tax=Helicobacter winghamensis TaxID=157268 RepID=UPI0018A38B58|nr:hypothetical protein [Helicobacter winghamensis]QOQ97960.1 hypothetical protein A0Z60_08060 [Helicobacter winghamensis]
MQVSLKYQSHLSQVKEGTFDKSLFAFNTAFESALKPKESKEIPPLELTLDREMTESIVGVAQGDEYFLQDLESLARSYPFETQKTISSPLNPFSYPRTLAVLGDLMEEKINELHTQKQDPKDPILQTLLLFKERFLEFPKTMESLKKDATSVADMFAMLSPKNLDKDKGGIYLQKAQELQQSIGAFARGVESGEAWIQGFFGAIEEHLSPFEKELVSEHLAIFQAHWREQTDSKNNGIALDNGMVYKAYSDSNHISGFDLIMDNRIFAYREKLLKDGSIEAVLAIFDKFAENTISLADLSGAMVQSFGEIEKMGYKATGVKTKIL